MKRIFSAILCIIMLASVAGCSASLKSFNQTMTIVTMPSPPKCKIFNDITAINEVLNTLGLVEKEEMLDEDVNGGWYYMIKLNVDGTELIYTLGGVFTDADGIQYKISNWNEIKEKLDEIYDKIDVEEIDYP